MGILWTHFVLPSVGCPNIQFCRTPHGETFWKIGWQWVWEGSQLEILFLFSETSWKLLVSKRREHFQPIRKNCKTQWIIFQFILGPWCFCSWRLTSTKFGGTYIFPLWWLTKTTCQRSWFPLSKLLPVHRKDKLFLSCRSLEWCVLQPQVWQNLRRENRKCPNLQPHSTHFFKWLVAPNYKFANPGATMLWNPDG